jgi:diguanylate cyclase (GGDEF)-like protein
VGEPVIMTARRPALSQLVRVALLIVTVALFARYGSAEGVQLGADGLVRLALFTALGAVFLIVAVPTMIFRAGFGRTEGTPGVITFDLALYAPLFALDGWFAAAIVGMVSHLVTPGRTEAYVLWRRLLVGGTRVPFWFLAGIAEHALFGPARRPAFDFTTFVVFSLAWSAAFIFLWFDPLTALRTGTPLTRLWRVHASDALLWLTYLIQIIYGYAVFAIALSGGTLLAGAALVPVAGLSLLCARLHQEMLRSYRLQCTRDAVHALLVERDPTPHVRAILASIGSGLELETIEVFAREDRPQEPEWRSIAVVGELAHDEREAGARALSRLASAEPGESLARAIAARADDDEVVGALVMYRGAQAGPLDRELASAARKVALMLVEFRDIAAAQRIAGTDALTGLLNRGRIERSLHEATARALPCAILLLDLDRFKEINDRLGHVAGDRALARVGEIIRAGIRTDDIAGRFGGEEFLVLMPSADLALGRMAAERLRRAIESSELRHADGSPVTASFGVTQIASSEAIGVVLERVDRALYVAKSSGRNRVEAAD